MLETQQDGEHGSIKDERQFEALFKQHYNALYAYAFAVCKADDVAEEVVQEIFLKLWERRYDMQIHTSWKAYLYKAVYHESLNAIKHQKVRSRYIGQQVTRDLPTVMEGDGELRKQLQVAMQRLPEKCRTVFQLSRFEELKYQEIANQLGISIKTVEAHMGKALKILRVQLADFLTCLLLIIYNF